MSGATDTEPDLGELATLIRVRRRAVGLSMSALAERAGVSRSTMHRVEAATSPQPSPSTLASVLGAVGLLPGEVAGALGGGEWGTQVLAALRRWELVVRPEWLRPEQAAEHLGIGTGALQRLKRAGVPHHPMDNNNGLCLYLASELDAWQASHRRRPTTPPKPEARQPRYQPRRSRAAG
jgi:transcriptional regulator with XRE-family HTH domain